MAKVDTKRSLNTSSASVVPLANQYQYLHDSTSNQDRQMRLLQNNFDNNQDSHEEHVSQDQQIDTHDSRCFECWQPGSLEMCGTCFRVFHESCSSLLRHPNSTINICNYCSQLQNNKCVHCGLTIFCENNIQLKQRNGQCFMEVDEQNNIEGDTQFLSCTLCYCQIHKNCSKIPVEISSIHSYFFQSASNYLCSQCIGRVKTAKILATQAYLDQYKQTLFFFLNALDVSPIHCFWISQADLIQRRDKGLNIVMNVIKSYETFCFPSAIQSIVDFRPPQTLRKAEFNAQVRNLKQKILQGQNPISYYGSFSNFRFLVRWKNKENYVWEDEKVVFNFIFPLKKFLVQCMFQMYMLEDNPQTYSEIHSLVFEQGQIDEFTRNLATKKKNKNMEVLNILFQPQTTRVYKSDGYNKVNLQAIFNVLCNGKSIEMISRSQSSSQSAQLLCKCIMKICDRNDKSRLIKPYLSIIITEEEHLQKWQSQLNLICPTLNILRWDESVDVQQCKKKEFLFKYLFFTQFQILLLTYQQYLKHHIFITSKIELVCNKLANISDCSSITDVIILDSLKMDFMMFSEIRFPQFTKFVILNQDRNQWFPCQVHAKFPHFQINAFPLNSISNRQLKYQKLEKQSLEEPIERQNMYSRNVNWSYQKRLAFHLYMISFGTNHFENIDELMTELNIKFPQIFNQPFSELERSNLRKYMELFLAVVGDYKHLEISNSKDTQQYLFHFSRKNVFKRITQLSKILNTLKLYSFNPNNFPYKIPFIIWKDGVDFFIKEWRGLQDFLLCKLIIKHGYGNWSSIQEDRSDWWLGVDEKFKDDKFGSYIGWILKCSGIDGDVIRMIQKRSENCLQLMA